jgi:hypothetical protein
LPLNFNALALPRCARVLAAAQKVHYNVDRTICLVGHRFFIVAVELQLGLKSLALASGASDKIILFSFYPLTMVEPQKTK